MRFGFLFILFLNVAGTNAQDRFLKKDITANSVININIKPFGIDNDSLCYEEDGKFKIIAKADVVAIKKRYKDPHSAYVYIVPGDERIYGIKNDKVFFKSDYKYDLTERHFAMECFLERFRVYDSVIPEIKKGRLYLKNNLNDKRKRLHKNVKLCISLKDDKQSRRFKGWVYNISNDTSLLIMKIKVNGKKNIYAFRNQDIWMVGMESPVVFLTRHTLALATISSGFFVWPTYHFYKSKWYRKFYFDTWKLSK